MKGIVVIHVLYPLNYGPTMTFLHFVQITTTVHCTRSFGMCGILNEPIQKDFVPYQEFFSVLTRVLLLYRMYLYDLI